MLLEIGYCGRATIQRLSNLEHSSLNARLAGFGYHLLGDLDALLRGLAQDLLIIMLLRFGKELRRQAIYT